MHILRCFQAKKSHW